MAEKKSKKIENKTEEKIKELKKNSEKDEEERKEKSEERGKDKHIMIIILALGILTLVFFISYYLFSNIGRFEYRGLSFDIIKFGDIPTYHYSYLYKYNGKNYEYNLYLRIDPRKNKALFGGDYAEEEMEFFRDKIIYITMEPYSFKGCQYDVLGPAQLSTFFSGNQLKVKGAVLDKNYSKEFNVTYASCENNPENPVIEIKEGKETKVIRNKPNCYELEISNCEIMDAVERLIIEIILDSKKRTQERLKEINNSR